VEANSLWSHLPTKSHRCRGMLFISCCQSSNAFVGALHGMSQKHFGTLTAEMPRLLACVGGCLSDCFLWSQDG
jgi:hypothetical protein